jgi:16S rRNA (adenine1518-N6/adenine1519-N6)-dimethyltransferase
VTHVLEVGPGPGVLTGPLSEKYAVQALEVDRRWEPVLAEVAPGAQVHWGDALGLTWADLMPSEPWAIVSNMPYQITGPLLERVEAARDRIAVAVLMMQREVAEKILAPASSAERGAVSVNLQAQFAIRKLVQVPAGAFVPPPKVDSTVLVLVPRTDPWPTEWRALVRQGFGMPRKTLVNNLGAWVAPMLADLGLSPTVRPHQVTEEQWRNLLSQRSPIN